MGAARTHHGYTAHILGRFHYDGRFHWQRGQRMPQVANSGLDATERSVVRSKPFQLPHAPTR